MAQQALATGQTSASRSEQAWRDYLEAWDVDDPEKYMEAARPRRCLARLVLSLALRVALRVQATSYRWPPRGYADWRAWTPRPPFAHATATRPLSRCCAPLPLHRSARSAASVRGVPEDLRDRVRLSRRPAPRSCRPEAPASDAVSSRSVHLRGFERRSTAGQGCSPRQGERRMTDIADQIDRSTRSRGSARLTGSRSPSPARAGAYAGSSSLRSGSASSRSRHDVPVAARHAGEAHAGRRSVPSTSGSYRSTSSTSRPIRGVALPPTIDETTQQQIAAFAQRDPAARRSGRTSTTTRSARKSPASSSSTGSKSTTGLPRRGKRSSSTRSGAKQSRSGSTRNYSRSASTRIGR
jgi:hypothetical protein